MVELDPDVPKRRVHAWVPSQDQGTPLAEGLKAVAMELGLTGWGRVLLDGRLELVAEGNADAVEELLLWVMKASERVEVGNLTLEDEPVSGEYSTFSVRD